MPLSISHVTLWPIHQELDGPIRAALTRASWYCPPGQQWVVSVEDGAAIGGLTTTLRGSHELKYPTDQWKLVDCDHRTFVYTRTSLSTFHGAYVRWVDEEFEQAVREALAGPDQPLRFNPAHGVPSPPQSDALRHDAVEHRSRGWGRGFLGRTARARRALRHLLVSALRLHSQPRA